MGKQLVPSLARCFLVFAVATILGCSGSGSSGSSSGGLVGNNHSGCAQVGHPNAGLVMTVTNLSGRTVSFDLMRNARAYYIESQAQGCNYGLEAAYSFGNGGWSDHFFHEDGQVYQLSNNSCVVIPIDVYCLVGGASMYVTANTAANSFISQMYSVGRPNEETYPDMFGLVEMNWNLSGDATWDISYVNSFGIPMQLSNGTNTVGIANGVSRSAIINSLVSGFSNDKYSNLYQAGIFPAGSSGSDIVRILSPRYSSHVLLDDIWESAIHEGLTNFAGTKGEYESFTYDGYLYTDYELLDNWRIRATCTNLTTGYSTKCIVSKVSTSNAIKGLVNFLPSIAAGESGTDMAGKFAEVVSAAINRGVLGSPQYWGNSSGLDNVNTYYQNWYQNSPYNVYAKVLTGYGVNHALYTEPYDSMSNKLLVNPSNNKISLTILPF